jgi:uncharacterized protein
MDAPTGRGACTVARVVELWRYPVKSMQGEPVASTPIGPAGVEWDRRWAVLSADGRALSAKTVPRLLLAAARVGEAGVVVVLPDGSEVAEGAPGDDRLSDWLGRPVRLVGADAGTESRYQAHLDQADDDSPVVDVRGPTGRYPNTGHAAHLLSTASVRAAAGLHPAGHWDHRRFRPNIVVDTDGEGFVEEGWVGSAMEVGEVRLDVARPTGRCSVPGREQLGAAADPGLVRALAREHSSHLGVYADVRRAGTIAVGDGLRLVGAT